jgi:sterol desaturase/sphingolipid hydroxylase (fatty acid hydroxylase superfamily)
MTEITVYTYAVPIIIALILGEAIYSNIKGLNFYKTNDTLGSYGLLAGNVVVSLLTKGSFLLFNIYLYQFRLFTINDLMHVFFVVVLTFAAIDFIYYWFHRCSHRIKFLWAMHMNHHSSEEMNFVVSLRQAWFAPFAKVIFFMPLPLIGFDPLITVVVGIVSTFWGVIGHTQWINKLGPLEYIFVTPSHHRVHHGSNDQYIDKNFGNLLIIWDKFFGTFEPEDEKVIYGIKENVKTFNPFKITFMLWIKMYEESKSAVGFKEKFLSFFGTLEWKPKKLQ